MNLIKSIYVIAIILTVSTFAKAQNSSFRLSDLIGEHYSTINRIMIERNGQLAERNKDNKDTTSQWLWYTYNGKSIGFKIKNTYCNMLILIESIKKYESLVSTFDSNLDLKK